MCAPWASPGADGSCRSLELAPADQWPNPHGLRQQCMPPEPYAFPRWCTRCVNRVLLGTQCYGVVPRPFCALVPYLHGLIGAELECDCRPQDVASRGGACLFSSMTGTDTETFFHLVPGMIQAHLGTLVVPMFLAPVHLFEPLVALLAVLETADARRYSRQLQVGADMLREVCAVLQSVQEAIVASTEVLSVRACVREREWMWLSVSVSVCIVLQSREPRRRMVLEPQTYGLVATLWWVSYQCNN